MRVYPKVITIREGQQRGLGGRKCGVREHHGSKSGRRIRWEGSGGRVRNKGERGDEKWAVEASKCVMTS
jgi:hypothetical protein